MAQYAWILGVRPGYEEEYKRRHDDIWPEMVEALRSAGISNYSIFRHESLFLWGSHANLRDPAYPGADEGSVDHCMPEAVVLVAATCSRDAGYLPRWYPISPWQFSPSFLR